MKTKKMIKFVAEQIAEGNESREEILVALIGLGAKATTAMAAITKGFKEAGIITVTSNKALSEAREYIKESMPDMETFRDVRLHAEDLQSKFEVNDDDEKGVASCVKLIREQLKEDDLPMPRKIQLGMISALRVEYFNDPSNEPESIEELAEYLIANVDVTDSAMNDELRKKLTVTAGTDFSVNYMIKHGLSLSDMN